jgi:hypothetical protein
MILIFYLGGNVFCLVQQSIAILPNPHLFPAHATVKVVVSMPHLPDNTVTETDPNIIEGPWKHHPPQRDLENGDPPAAKRE